MSNIYNVDNMDINQQKFRDFDSAVRALYDTIPLTDIESLIFGEKTSVVFFSDVLRRKKNLKPFPYSDFKIYDGLVFLSRDIKYCTALLYFFRPYIVDSSNGTYFKTIEDSRYLMYANMGFQSIYNFWDRIGDLLDIYFKTGLSEKSLYLSRVLNNFPIEYKTSENYIRLNDIFKNEVSSFLGERDHIVHHHQLDCEFFWKIIESSGDPQKSSEIQQEKEGLPEKFKRQIDLTREAFSLTLMLIDELPNISYQ